MLIELSDGNTIDVEELVVAMQDGYPRYIDEGCFSQVHAISDDLVVKVHKFGTTSLDNQLFRESVERFNTEFRIQKRLYEGGVSVPKPLGVFKVSLVDSYKPGLVMERLYGVNGEVAIIENLVGYEELNAMIEEELKNVRSLGVYPTDVRSRNTIYDPSTCGFWLIDFDRWTTTKPNGTIVENNMDLDTYNLAALSISEHKGV